MASAAIGGAAFVTHPSTIPPAPAVMAILDRFNRGELGNTLQVLVALLDIWDAPDSPDEPDFGPSEGDRLPGDPTDHEPAGDDKDAAWAEWQSMRGSQKGGANILAAQDEDDQEDDSASGTLLF